MPEVERRDVVVEKGRSPWGVVGAIVVILLILFLLYALFNWWANGSNSSENPVSSPSTSLIPSTSPSAGGTSLAPSTGQ